MSIHTFSLDGCDVKETRSLHEDTIHVAVALSVNGQMIGDPQTKFIGNRNSGTFPINLSFPNIDVPVDAPVIMRYQILNSGHTPSAVAEALKGWLNGRMLGAGKLIDLVFANCDGPITPADGRQIEWNRASLNAIPAGTKFEDTQN